MDTTCNRRTFLAASAAMGLAMAARSAPAAPATFKTKLEKALIVGKVTEAGLAPIKAAGFDGVETSAWNVSPADASAAREVAAKVGLRIHSVLWGWAQFNSKDPAALEKSIADVAAGLRAAAAYGAQVLLLVPCRIGDKNMAMPQAWEFALEFDEKTNHLQRVVAGDNQPYKDYLAAHNHAIDTSREAVKKLIAVAEETKVVIGLENVWNNLWVSPAHFQNFVASFGHPMVKAYLDLGNHVKYAPTPQWVKALGPLLARCHVKDFKLNPDGHGGNFVNIRDGSIDWPATRQALEAAGYSGWMTIEGGNLSPAEHAKRLDQIIAGV